MSMIDNRRRKDLTMTEDEARELLKASDSIFAAQDRMLELGGFTRIPLRGQWLSPKGEEFWRDDALRIVECNALEALGRNPYDGRMP
jgi:hypothetical protein